MKDIHAVSFSGGRSSGMMVLDMVEKGKTIDYVIFANTGMETDETKEFLCAFNEQALDGKLVCIEFAMIKRTDDEIVMLKKRGRKNPLPYKRGFKKVDVEQMDMTGTPFKAFTRFLKALPSHARRHCTQELKVNINYNYIYSHHNYKETYINRYLGFRADEPKRLVKTHIRADAYETRLNEGKKPLKYTGYEIAPLADQKITRADVLRFWSKKPIRGLSFDPSDENVRLSNCYGCFFGNEPEMVSVARNRPDMAERWAEMERWVNDYKRKNNKPMRQQKETRKKWIMANLDREPKKEELENWGFQEYATWDLILELVRSGKMTSQEKQGVLAIAGGCKDGECGTDLAVEQ